MKLFEVLVWLRILSSFCEGSYRTVETIYTKGIASYNKGNWFDCYDQVKSAIDLQRDVQTKLAFCRKTCKTEHSDHLTDKALKGSILELHFLNSALKISSCVRHCEKVQGLSQTYTLSNTVKLDFEKKIQYDYLQFCAFKVCCYALVLSLLRCHCIDIVAVKIMFCIH